MPPTPEWTPRLDLGVAVALLAGASIAALQSELPSTSLQIALGLLALAALLRRRPWAWAIAHVLLGYLWTSVAAQSRLDAQWPAARDGQTATFEVRVLGLPERGERAWRFEARLPVAQHGLPAGALLRLSWFDHDEALLPGQCWKLQVKLRGPRGLVNPGGFDFERHAVAQGIAATGYVSGPAVACGEHASLHALRASIAADADRYLEPGTVRAVLKALAIGDTRELSDADWDLFRATGTTHLIAISGLHVGLAAGMGALLFWLVYQLLPGLALRVPRPLAMALGALLAAAGYSALAGFALPTQRTLVSLAAALSASLLRRDLGWWQRYALALIALLAFDPLAVLTPGFWLSFGAVAWLIYAFSGAWRSLHWGRAAVLSQLGLSLALLPLTLVFFQEASVSSPLVNLLAVPWITLVIVPLLLLALVMPVALLQSALWSFAAWLLAPLIELMRWVHAADVGRLLWPQPDPLAVLLATLGLLWLLAPRGIPMRALGLLLLFPLLWPRSPALPDEAYEVVLLDVGQGQAILVRTATHALLIDTGPGFPDGGDLSDRVVLPSLLNRGVTRLDGIVVSHGDLDHAGGHASLRRRLPETQVWSGETDRVPGASACQAGQGWTWDGVDFAVLHPPEHFPSLGNESSCVLRISSRHGSVLIPGDIGEVIESRLVREQAAALDVDVLVAGHHGSRSSSSDAWLAAVSPDWVVYSVGYLNRFGFPAAEVRARVAAHGAQQADTAQSGALHIGVGAAGISLHGERALRPRWWRR